jgi:uncharacterized protein YecE (DUF72 family)
MKKKKIYVGTSGWNYDHWKGPFYPKDIKPKDEFKYYIDHFKTVEINSTFYRLPSKKTLLNWKKSSPKDFIFSIKASRYITHVKRLKEPKKSLSIFLSLIKNIKPKLGPILFQTPPNWKVNIKRFENFIKFLDKNYKYAFEFRDRSWLIEDIFDLLKKNNLAFCIYDLQGFQTPIEITADFVYVRLHGPKSAYSGSYSKKNLKKWAKLFKKLKKNKLDIFCYFNNDEKAYAVKNAQEFKRLIRD